jgi:hypothetical protein
MKSMTRKTFEKKIKDGYIEVTYEMMDNYREIRWTRTRKVETIEIID